MKVFKSKYMSSNRDKGEGQGRPREMCYAVSQAVYSTFESLAERRAAEMLTMLL